MPEYEINVEFKLYGLEFDHEKISKTLKIEPTFIWKKGEALSEGSSLCNEDNGWGIVSHIKKSELLENHIKALMSLLYPIKDKISEFTSTCRAELNIAIYVYHSVPEIHISTNAIEFLSNIRCEVDIDIYGLT